MPTLIRSVVFLLACALVLASTLLVRDHGVAPLIAAAALWMLAVAWLITSAHRVTPMARELRDDERPRVHCGRLLPANWRERGLARANGLAIPEALPQGTPNLPAAHGQRGGRS